MTDWAKLATQNSSVSKDNNNGALQGPWNALMDKSVPGIGSIGQIPLAGGLIRGAGDEAAQLGQQALQESITPSKLPGIISMPLGEKQILGGMDKTPNKYMSSSQYSAATDSNPVGRTLAAAGPGLNTVGNVVGVKGGVDLVKNLPDIVRGTGNYIKMLTPKGSGQAINSAHTAATATGATDTMQDVLTDMKLAVEDKFAPKGLKTADENLQKTFGNMVKHVTGTYLSPKTLVKMKDYSTIPGELTPSDLVKARQTIVNRYGYNPENGNLEQNVANVVRDVLTKRAKDLTPGLADADAAYVKSLAIQKIMKGIGPNLLRMAGIGAGGAGIIGLGQKLMGGSQDNPQP